MTIEQVGAWRTSDGALYDSADKAKDAEFKIKLAALIEAIFPGNDGYVDITDRLYEARYKLKSVVGELNGGSTIVRLPSAEPEPPRAA